MIDAPSCSDCAHCANGWCRRSVGRHFNANSNSYRTRLNVSCAGERASDRTLTRRRKCGPVGMFFEPKAAALPMVRVHDAVGDSDGDDGA